MATISGLNFAAHTSGHDLSEENLLKTLLGVTDSGKRKFKIIGEDIKKNSNNKWVDDRRGQDAVPDGGTELYKSNMSIGMGLKRWNDEVRTDLYNVVCKLQQGKSELCDKKFTQLLTTLLYRRGGSPWSLANTFDNDIKNLDIVFKVIDVLAHNTLDNWHEQQHTIENGKATIGTRVPGSRTGSNKPSHENGTKIAAELAKWETSKGGNLSGGGDDISDSSYKQWMKSGGPNIFLLLNALYNLNIMGFRTGGLFQVEPANDYFAEFNTRMGISEDFNIHEYKDFIKWVEVIIDIVNSNREIFDSGTIVGNSTPSGLGPYKSYMDTSEKVYNIQWVGQGSPFDMWATGGLNTIRYIFDNYGTRSNNYMRPVSVVLPGGGNNDFRIGNITFNEIVSNVKGTDNSSEFIGGYVSKNNNYEGALLISKLRTYYQNIKTALSAQNQKLDDESDSFMESLLNDITIMVNTVENQLKNLANWLKSQHDIPVNPGTPEEVSLERMLKEYSNTMYTMRSKMNEWSDNTNQIQILINGKKV